MEWVIVFTGLFLVYVFGIRRRGRGVLLDTAAHGAAGGSRRALSNHFRRSDLIMYVIAGFAVIFTLGLLFAGDDDTSESDSETAEAEPTTGTISGPLSVGDSGPDVVILQERLAAVGLPVAVDGVYGPETSDAVMAFQEREQLTVNGVVESETAEALGIWSG
jgi:Putative peptidoglycan binding domain